MAIPTDLDTGLDQFMNPDNAIKSNQESLKQVAYTWMISGAVWFTFWLVVFFMSERKGWKIFALLGSTFGLIGVGRGLVKLSKAKSLTN